MSDVRIDKWLWAVRIYKTRSDAAEACRTNKVTINGAHCKPSREVKEGDVVGVRKVPFMTYTWRVLGLIDKRQGAQNVATFAENITPESELEKLSAPRETIFIQRDRGTGRPTKKERRDMDSLMDTFYFGDE